MNPTERGLREICGSEERYRVLSYLFSNAGSAHHARGIAQEAGVDPSNANRLLGRLVDAGLCTRSVDRLYVRYQAREDHPLFKILVDAFTQTSEYTKALQAAAEKVPGTTILFGSYAKGRARPDSDIDLLVINDQDAITTVAQFKPTSRKLQREIQVTTATPSEVAAGVQQGDAFWRDIFSNPYLVLKGEVPHEVREGVLRVGLEGVHAAPDLEGTARGPSLARR